MEELQSTEVLDREILEDARRKAYRILKTSDETLKANAAAWEKKARDAVDELKRKYAERQKLAAAEIMARLPMDLRRAKAERIEELLREAEENWYKALSREKVLAILKKELSRRLRECPEFAEAEEAGEKPRVFIRCLAEAEAEALLEEVLPGRAFRVEERPAGPGASRPGIVLESRAVRITASVDMAVDAFFHEKRAEVAAALLGQDAAFE
ncbi:MAG: ATPase, partial [Treponema sp.]|nr:ATPase [Treponema sp.]